MIKDLKTKFLGEKNVDKSNFIRRSTEAAVRGYSGVNWWENAQGRILFE